MRNRVVTQQTSHESTRASSFFQSCRRGHVAVSGCKIGCCDKTECKFDEEEDSSIDEIATIFVSWVNMRSGKA